MVDWIEKMKEAGRRTTMDEAKIIGAQIISGLSYCHERNKVHLDLKPRTPPNLVQKLNSTKFQQTSKRCSNMNVKKK